MAEATLPLPLPEGKTRLEMRRCRVCHESKPLHRFEIRGPGRRRACCRDCINARQRAEYAAKPSRRAYLRKWDAQNLEKKRAYGRISYRKARSDLKSALTKTLSAKRSYCNRRGIEMTITADDVVDLYNSQGGLCALTGRTLVWGTVGVQRDSLSIDRMDQSAGYVPGNIRLVTYQANFARNAFSDQELFAFCEAVLQVRPGRAQAHGTEAI